jgi:DNA-directed RNA polymerase specialized sigma24 family protein
MASTAKAGQTARQKARERRIALEAEAKARNDRIENWTAVVFTGVEDRNRALQAAASAEDVMADGLIGLAGEGLTTSEVADLCEMTVGEVQKLMKRRRDTAGGTSGSVGVGSGGPAVETQRESAASKATE